MIEELESKLDSFDPGEREKALAELCEKVRAGQIDLPEAGADVNLHCHTFFSYNTYGYSPSKFAWLARKAGLAVAEVVDFDVLDALEEFLEAGRMLGLKLLVCRLQVHGSVCAFVTAYTLHIGGLWRSVTVWIFVQQPFKTYEGLLESIRFKI